MRYDQFIAAGLLILAGCNNSPTINEKNASVDEVAQKVREASAEGGFVRPGEWQSSITIEKFDVPGMPADAAAQMRKAVAQNAQRKFKSCLTKEDAEQPKGKFFTGNDECRYDHFKMGKGVIDAAMQCPAGQGMTQVVAMKGNYTPNSYDLNMSMTSKGMQGPAAAMEMKMRVQSQRIGECTENDIADANAAASKG